MGTEDALVADEDGQQIDQDDQDSGDGVAAGSEEGAEDQEVEIVRSGDAGSRPEKQYGYSNRINKLNQRNAAANAETEQLQKELEIERTKAAMAMQALENQKATAPPDPDDFDDGVNDPRYAQAKRESDQAAIKAEVTHQVQAMAPAQPAIDPGIEARQRQHYERATKLGVKNFEDVEDKAIDIIGKDSVNFIIDNSDSSHLVTYYLGKNPREAENLRALVETNPLKAVVQIGRLEAELSVKPSTKSQIAPDPDENLSGNAPRPEDVSKWGPKGATYT